MTVQKCPCKIDRKANAADCSDRNPRLTSVPKCVPRSVQKLNLSHNKFNKLQRRQFEDFNKLVFLDISGSFIEHLSEETFTGLSELETLLLTDNWIENLNTTHFVGVPKLRVLDLMANHIEDIEGRTFSRLINLRHLNIGYNRLSYIKPHVFDGLSTLKQLELYFNHFKYASSFPVDVFKPLTSLVEINIAENCHIRNCTYIDIQLSALSSLEKLYMDGYPKQVLGPGFDRLRKLEEIHLINCNLSEITEKTFYNFRNSRLRTFDLGFCYINVIYPFSFSFLKNLDSLLLDHNYNFCDEGILNSTIGLNSTKIRHIDFSSTCRSSWHLSPATIQQLQNTKLEVLKLSMSSIMFINPTVFEYLPQTLKHLYLHGNRLSMIDLTYLSVLNNLKTLYINDQREDSSALTANHEGQHLDSTIMPGLDDKNKIIRKVSIESRNESIELELLSDTNAFDVH